MFQNIEIQNKRNSWPVVCPSTVSVCIVVYTIVQCKNLNKSKHANYVIMELMCTFVSVRIIMDFHSFIIFRLSADNILKQLFNTIYYVYIIYA